MGALGCGGIRNGGGQEKRGEGRDDCKKESLETVETGKGAEAQEAAGWRKENRMLELQLAHCRPTPARDHHALQEEGDDRVSL